MGANERPEDQPALQAIRAEIYEWIIYGSRADVGSAIDDYSKLLSRNRSCEASLFQSAAWLLRGAYIYPTFYFHQCLLGFRTAWTVVNALVHCPRISCLQRICRGKQRVLDSDSPCWNNDCCTVYVVAGERRKIGGRQREVETRKS